MLAQALIYRRESLGLKINDIVSKTGMNEASYRILENPIARKMTQEEYKMLDPVLMLGEKFYDEYVTPYSSFGEIFKQKREELGLSLTDLSNLTGICRQYIWKLENNCSQKLLYSIFEKMRDVLRIEDEENFEPFFNRKDRVKINFVNDGYFGKLIHEKRLKLELSQEELGLRVNVHDSLISKLEMEARTSVTVKTAIKLMDELYFTETEKKRYLVR